MTTLLLSILTCLWLSAVNGADDTVYSCGGFIKSSVPIPLKNIMVRLFTPEGNLKYETDVAPNNGYYMLPVYDKGDYVIRLQPPDGWAFEPTHYAITVNGVDDVCTMDKDINFEFLGFPVVGRVVSGEHASEGPQGFDVNLLSAADGSVVQTAKTKEGGSYTFAGVQPGSYKIVGASKNMCAQRKELSVKVDTHAVNVADKLVIQGYALSGYVHYNSKPMADVELQLYSSKSVTMARTSCDSSPPNAENTPTGLIYVCRTRSDKNGRFSFACAPPAQYSVRPVYYADGVEYTFAQDVITMNVDNAPAQFKEPLQMTGFSMSGKIVWSTDGAPIANADIMLNGQKSTKSSAGGLYTIANLNNGAKIELSAVVADAEFASTVVTVAATSGAKLPTLTPTKLHICGRITMGSLPTGVARMDRREVTVTQLSNERKHSIVSEKGDVEFKFCEMMEKGRYKLEPVLSQAERAAGIELMPKELVVSVDKTPLKDIVFTQFSANLNGQIQCIVSCANVRVVVTDAESGRTMREETMPSARQSVVSYSFKNMLAGKYNVKIVAPHLCWSADAQPVTIASADVDGVNFVQTAFVAHLSTTNDVRVNWQFKDNAVVKGTIDLRAATSPARLCLPAHGSYSITPVDSCHTFDRPNAQMSTSESSIASMTLTAVAHKVEGRLTVGEDVTSVEVVVESDKEKTRTIAAVRVGKSNEYKYSFAASTASQLSLSASSNLLLFDPPTIEVEVDNDCLIVKEAFVGVKGQFMRGSVTPKVEAVTVTMTHEGGKVYNAVTDANGKYEIGPLRSLTGFTLTAERVGYTFTKTEDKSGDFRAFKLSELSISMVSSTGEPLGGVLVSVSGGEQGFRSNNITDASGTITFIALAPGDYFIRAVLKEYKFAPPTVTVTVKEGSTERVKLSAKRFAYSAFGVVRHLAGLPVADATVEAVSDACNQLHEAATTNAKGEYRIRGLVPGCSYRVSVVAEGAAAVGTIPMHHTVEVGEKDVQHIEYIVQPVFSHVQINGHIDVADQSLMSSLRVVIYKDSSPDTALYTMHMSAVQSSSMFFINDVVPMDGQRYTVRLEASLDRSHFSNFRLPEVTVVANESAHFIDLEFKPVPGTVDVEVSQSGLMLLPCLLFIVLVAYNRQALLPYANDAMGVLVDNFGSAVRNVRNASPRHQQPYVIPAEYDTDAQSSTAKRRNVKAKKT